MSDQISKNNYQSLKQIVTEIFLQTIRQINPEKLITDRIKLQDNCLTIDNEQIELSRFDRVLVIGFGKASLKMAVALESMLGDRITDGLVATNSLPENTR